MQKDNYIFIEHVLSRLNSILEYTQNMDEDDFLRNKLVQDAVLRNFEVIGEATKNLSTEFRLQHPELPWSKLAGMRDKLIHFYFGIDLQIIWTTVVEMVPELKIKIKKIIDQAGSQD